MARIGIEAQRIFRAKKHGMDMVALETVRHLQAIDSEHEYVVFVKPDEDVCVTSSSKVKIVELPATTYPYWEQVMLPGAAKKHGVELLHCTSNTAPLSLSMPLVVTLHDIIYLEKAKQAPKGATLYQKMGRLYRKWNVPRIVPKASALITVSAFEKTRIQQYFGSQTEVEVVYNGISDTFFTPPDAAECARVQAAYALPERFIFFLGNTDPKKNLPNVLKAAISILEQADDSLHVVIADYERERIRQLLNAYGKPELETRFVLPGYMKNSDLPAVYARSEVFLYPSLRESFGIPIIEAQASGAALVTSDTSSMPEIAGKGACLVDPTRPEEIVSAVIKITSNPEYREKLIEDGRRNARRFSWKNTAQQTVKVYEKVLGQS